MIDFRILGALEVRSGTAVFRPRGSLQRRLLVALLASAPNLVLADSLITELWSEDCPARVENALQAHISRLRQQLAALEPDRPTPRLVAHASGYQLDMDPSELDAARFVRGLERERLRLLSEGDPERTVRALRELLALWRGPVLGGAADSPLCQAAADRYEESHLAALELLFDVELEVGEHAKIVPGLRDLLKEYPFHERFRQQLMIALYRAGRQAEALDAYRELWRRLTEELGIEPTPAMREYERAVLRHDPILSAARIGLPG